MFYKAHEPIDIVFFSSALAATKIPFWLIVKDGATVIHLIVIAVKDCSAGVICTVSSISGMVDF